MSFVIHVVIVNIAVSVLNVLIVKKPLINTARIVKSVSIAVCVIISEKFAVGHAATMVNTFVKYAPNAKSAQSVGPKRTASTVRFMIFAVQVDAKVGARFAMSVSNVASVISANGAATLARNAR